MFTGIVEEIGVITQVSSSGAGALQVHCARVLDGSRIGDSIAVNGVCLTVTEVRDGGFAADLQPVTLRLSNFAKLRVGDNVNLERSLAVGDRFGGHYVQGHIDGIARIVALVGEGPAVLVRIWLPVDLRRYVVERGFITVDGASLTVMRLFPDGAEVSLVDHTQESITLPQKGPDDWVNVEVDVMAKYVERLQGLAQKTDISMDLLRQNGFA